MKRNCGILISLIILSMGLFGCATYQAKTISVNPIEGYASSTKKEGIYFAAEPFDTSVKAKDAFYADVTSYGYYPVQLIFKNANPDKILVLRETVELESKNAVRRDSRARQYMRRPEDGCSYISPLRATCCFHASLCP